MIRTAIFVVGMVSIPSTVVHYMVFHLSGRSLGW